jgi:ABC-type antimicrobial peptide transport system ATPase subunit
MTTAPLLEAQNLRKQFPVSAGVHAGARSLHVLNRPEHPYTQALLAAVLQIFA